MSTDHTDDSETTINNKTVIKERSNSITIHPPSCPCCGSDNVYGMSRVVGYFSIIGNWNNSKQAELKKRQEGNYWK